MRGRALSERTGKLLHARQWFPHSIFGLALFGIGAHLLVIMFVSKLTPLWQSGHFDTSSFDHLNLNVVDLIRLAIGLSMVVMSIGLLLRSRLAWVLTLLLLAAITLLQIKHSGSHPPWWVYYDGVLLIALLIAHRSFSRSSVAAATLYALTATLMLLFYAVFGAYYLGNDFKPAITDLATALYYSVVTMATVGFGDIAPVTSESRMFTVSVIVLGITVFATSLGAVVGPAMSNSVQRIINRRERPMPRKDHFIVIGATALANNTYHEIRKRNLPATLVLLERSPGSGLENADVVIGDASDVAVLRKAGAETARAVLAMRDDDSENAFIILALKELEAKAKSVVVVNDIKNYKRLQRVHPDMIVAPQILGGELLAMALSGEPISEDFVMKRLFNANHEDV